MSYGLIQETYTKSVVIPSVELFTQNVLNAEFITLEVDVTGDPLTSFTIKMKGHSASPLFDMYSSSEDYIDPKGLLRGASCDMTILNGSGWVMLDTRGLTEIGLSTSSSGTSNVTVRVGG